MMSIGDLAQSFVLRNRNAALKQDMLRLTQELSTGQITDIRGALAGNHTYLTEIERNLTVLDGYDVATTEATIFANATQTALARIQDVGNELANSLMIKGNSTVGSLSTDTAAEAKASLATIVATLNTKAAGRSVFGGTATDRPAVASVETLLAGLKSAIAGAATPADMVLNAKAWFDDPAGFDAIAYQGADKPLAAISLSDTEEVRFDLRATEPRLKDVLLFAGLAALADDPALAFADTQKAELFVEAGTSMLGARDAVIALRSRIGFVEAQIDGIATRNAAERTSAEFEKTSLLQVDPYETATKLEEVQFQLQSLYAVTAKMSQLSLVNFL